MTDFSKSTTPTILIVFGATGDLMRRKLIPSLYQLYQQKLLPPLFHVIGYSRREWSDDEFRALVSESLHGRIKNIDDGVIHPFLHLFSYSSGLFDTVDGYNKLAKRLGVRDKEWSTCANKFFYLAVPPEYYETIFRHLADSHLATSHSKESGWTRVIVEKPFGKDLKTAEKLDALLGKLFSEEQIYRIDHYLGKETVQNILAFRFSNSFLEHTWNRHFIERIHIKISERIGIEGRGEFFDGVGLLRDVGQNHMLQLLALFTMDTPQDFDPQTVRAKRAEVLRALQLFTSRDVTEHTIRAQYDQYKNEKNVDPSSNTETYYLIRAFIKNARWRGVPIILENGKSLKDEIVKISVKFRHPTPCLCPEGKHFHNVLRYQIQPDERITISFWVKRPGTEILIEEKDFAFDYKQAYPDTEFMGPYEKLLLDVLDGNQTLFVSTAEIMASWRFVDNILSAWKRGKQPILTYAPGSDGPLERTTLYPSSG
ncbi:glucose-6-phosphate dehydrogenase [Candidatus Uhrbacteria bacterium]|nr:glucose-6-phosphate dehydrogenase [Candidatus Uhrbacteria bacterium]